MDWFVEEVYCNSCKENHTRMNWHSLGYVCARCNKHTGNNNQGHYWKFCHVLADKAKAEGKDSWKNGMADEFHFCCPDDCELEEKNERASN